MPERERGGRDSEIERRERERERRERDREIERREREREVFLAVVFKEENFPKLCE